MNSHKYLMWPRKKKCVSTRGEWQLKWPLEITLRSSHPQHTQRVSPWSILLALYLPFPSVDQMGRGGKEERKIPATIDSWTGGEWKRRRNVPIQRLLH